MRALVLEEKQKLSLRDFPIEETVGPYDVRIKIKACGICGSDVHYYVEGAIGDFVVDRPMVLGHEASGVIIEKGSKVTDFEIGDRVCMEPGVPDMNSSEVMEGNYHLDPDIVFWATPPVHGCLRETVVHPARFCFKLPESLSFQEGAMMEPLATGIEAAKKAHIKPGDTALVVGCGTIGIMCAISALAGGCSKVYISDIKQEKLDIAGTYPNIAPINSAKVDLADFIRQATNGHGCDLVFEASGNPHVYPDFVKNAKRGGTIVIVGMENGNVPMNISWMQVHGLSVQTLFRYTNTFGRAVALVNAGKIDVKRLISKTFDFEQSVEAYEYAAQGRPDVVKVMIQLP